MIERIVRSDLEQKLHKGKAILIFGARQVGKTTLLKSVFRDKQVLWLNGDEPDVRLMLTEISSARLKSVIGENKYLVIDEAQRIPDIGITIKLIVDNIPDVQVIATGSSALDLANKSQEPLTGRKWIFNLFPFSFKELSQASSFLDETSQLKNRLIYGSYPEVVNNPGNEKEILRLLSESYIYKDILMIEGINKPEKLVKLLQAIAYQVGSEVSYSELGRMVDLNNETVEKYIDLLEKSFVIFRLKSLSRNHRKELKLGRKIYFFDNGIRNSVIGQFAPIETRLDKGALWENYLISERVKYNAYTNRWISTYFWRTQDQQEIDYLEESDGLFEAFEFKWSEKRNPKFSKSFLNNYSVSGTKLIHSGNYQSFIGYE
jgi:predicted AAA+ superfamily ATPase